MGIWSGNDTDAMRKLAAFHDLVNLAADTFGRRPELYVVGGEPIRFLRTSRTTARWALDRGAASTRRLFAERLGDLGTTIEEFAAGDKSRTDRRPCRLAAGDSRRTILTLRGSVV